MPRRLPSLTALKTFEAAARHLSFARAAEELFLTPSAVSHQIKSLEQQLAVSLFKRHGRKIELSDAGARYYPVLRQSFDAMAEATAKLEEVASVGALTLSVVPTFAVRWLIPHLSDFQDKHPEIELRLMTHFQIVSFDDTDVDAAIRFGQGNWPGLTSRLLLQDEVVPVASPDYLARHPGLQHPSDLDGHTLLHDLNRPHVWRHWLEAVNQPLINPEAGPKFETTNLAIQAASQGMGLVPANPLLLQNELASGQLVEVFDDLTLPVNCGYYFVYPPRRQDCSRVHVFEDWLFDLIADITDTERPANHNPTIDAGLRVSSGN
mgnify:FL=1